MNTQALKTKQKTYTVALAGQPNTGKSTIFNRLTGANQHVGNWPGKTVEKKEGVFKHDRESYTIVDLPGTYSLTANSLEEIITRDFIIKEEPDVVVVVVDASQLERTLYLLAEIIMMGKKVVVALNMMDVAEKEGCEILHDVMEKAMGVKVIPMVASKKKGVSELLDAIDNCIKNGKSVLSMGEPVIQGNALSMLNKIKSEINGLIPSSYPEEWTALKLLEGDREIIEIMRDGLGTVKWSAVEKITGENGSVLLQ